MGREHEAVAADHDDISGGLSLREIAQRLEEGGHEPKAGERWHPTQVMRVLARADKKAI